jgi:hypothetical protein
MRRPAGNWLLMTVMVGALAACTSSKEVPVDPNLFPTDYKRDILDLLSNSLIDPTNIRNASISDPALAPVDKEQRYIVCLRYTPRDAARQYTGATERIGYFYGGHLNQLVEASQGQCSKAAYKPFPELEKLCRSEHKCV